GAGHGREEPRLPARECASALLRRVIDGYLVRKSAGRAHDRVLRVLGLASVRAGRAQRLHLWRGRFHHRCPFAWLWLVENTAAVPDALTILAVRDLTPGDVEEGCGSWQATGLPKSSTGSTWRTSWRSPAGGPTGASGAGCRSGSFAL